MARPLTSKPSRLGSVCERKGQFVQFNHSLPSPHNPLWLARWLYFLFCWRAGFNFPALTLTIEDDLSKLLLTPASANVDGVQVVQRPLGDVVAALKYLNARKAASGPLRFQKIASGDATGNTPMSCHCRPSTCATSNTAERTVFMASLPPDVWGSDGDQVQIISNNPAQLFDNSYDLIGAIYERISGHWTFRAMGTLNTRTTFPNSAVLPTGYEFRLINQPTTTTSDPNGVWRWDSFNFVQVSF